MSIKRITATVLVSGILCFSMGLSGCGYTTRSLITGKYKSIYIPQFINKIDITQEANAAMKYTIYKPMLESDITKSVINRFLYDGNLRPAKSDSADVVLKGELLEFRRDPLRYDSSDNVEEYRLTLVVHISLWDSKED